MIQSIFGAFQLLRSKALQITLAVGLAILVLLKANAEIRQDAEEDLIRDLEKQDEARAQDVRDSVSDVPKRVQLDPSDARGFRD